MEEVAPGRKLEQVWTRTGGSLSNPKHGVLCREGSLQGVDKWGFWCATQPGKQASNLLSQTQHLDSHIPLWMLKGVLLISIKLYKRLSSRHIHTIVFTPRLSPRPPLPAALFYKVLTEFSPFLPTVVPL